MLDIRELTRDEMHRILPLAETLNAIVAPAILANRLAEMLDVGFRCIGAFDGEDLIGIAGFWTGCRLWCGRYIDLDNIVVAEPRRNQGVGAQLIDWIHEEAKRLDCNIAVLDSYIENTPSHRFYERYGYEKRGYHFVKPL